MKIRLLFLAAIFAILCGCSNGEAEQCESVVIYRLSSDESGTALVPERIALNGGEAVLDAVLRGLNAQPETEGLESAFPSGAAIEDCYIRNGRAQVRVSSGYAELEGLERTYADYAMIYSLSMLDEVCMADVIFDSHVLEYGVRADNALLGDTLCEETPVICKIFLPDDEMKLLDSKTLELSSFSGNTAEQVARQTIERLEALPEGTELVSIAVENGCCTLELSEQFYATEPATPQKARLIIGTIVNSLCFQKGIDSVVIMVNGAPITSYGGYATQWPAVFDSLIVRR